MVNSGVQSITQTCIKCTCLLENCFFWCLVTYEHVSLYTAYAAVQNHSLLEKNIQSIYNIKVPVYQGLLPLLYEGVMEEDCFLVMVADILGQSFDFQYGLSSMVCYTTSAGHLYFTHKYLDLISMWSLKRRWLI